MEQQWDIYANVEEPSHDDSKWRREMKCSEDIYANECRMDIMEPHNTGAALSGNKHAQGNLYWKTIFFYYTLM